MSDTLEKSRRKKPYTQSSHQLLAYDESYVSTASDQSREAGSPEKHLEHCFTSPALCQLPEWLLKSVKQSYLQSESSFLSRQEDSLSAKKPGSYLWSDCSRDSSSQARGCFGPCSVPIYNCNFLSSLSSLSPHSCELSESP